MKAKKVALSQAMAMSSFQGYNAQTFPSDPLPFETLTG
jgi:hypothetical protein